MVSSIRIQGSILYGFFQNRPNRFLTLVKVDKKIHQCFLPDPGRLLELLTPGVKVILRKVECKKNRKTEYDLIGVIHKNNIISVDSRIPNKLVLEALKNGDIEELNNFSVIKPEYPYGQSRLDFFLASKNMRCLLEVKSCTLVKDNVALFPDAPTKRGIKHLIDLMKAKKEGYRTCVLFLIQRNDAVTFSPNDETDPKFGKILRNAALEGVEIYAYSSIFTGKKISLDKKVPVKLNFQTTTSPTGYSNAR